MKNLADLADMCPTMLAALLGNGPHVLGNGPHVLGNGPHVLGNRPYLCTQLMNTGIFLLWGG